MKPMIFHVSLMVVACTAVFTTVYFGSVHASQAFENAFATVGIIGLIPGLLAAKWVRKEPWSVSLLYLGAVGIAVGGIARFSEGSDERVQFWRNNMREAILNDWSQALRDPPRRSNAPVPAFAEVQ